MTIWGWMRKKTREQIFAEENAGKLLDEMINTCNGSERRVTIRFYSARQVHKAIKDFAKCNPFTMHPPIKFSHEWYQGIVDDRLVLIKKHERKPVEFEDYVYQDIVVTSIMSSHNNVLKLLGCCLEFRIPALIYEYPEKGSFDMNARMAHGEPLSWKSRLKNVREVADALTYLNAAFPRDIIIGYINPTNIFLDQDCNVKLSNFVYPIPNPYVEDGCGGKIGFIDPYHMETGQITQKTVVFSFGVLLVVFITGKCPWRVPTSDLHKNWVSCVKDLVEENRLNEVVDPAMLGIAARNELEQQHSQLQACLDLALRCINSSPKDRPRMFEIAKELQQIEESNTAEI